MPEPIRAITLLYDPDCPLCLRCRSWMGAQASLVEIKFLQSNSPEATRRFGQVPWLGEELVVVADSGEVWVGAAAFIVALWALRDWRSWSFRLSGTMLAPLAERFFVQISRQRHWLGALFRHQGCPDGHCQTQYKSPYR